jgi:ribose transport system substrate-binding protein
VLVREVAKAFGVSPMTVRTDLNALAADGLALRIRGGAAAPPGAPARPPLVEAEAVVREAAALVEDAETLALDGDDLCFHVACALQERRHLTVLAGAVDTAQRLAAEPSNTVVLAGSLLRPDGRSLELHPAERPLHGLRVRLALVSCDGCGPHGELYDDDPYAAQLKQAMLQAAERVVVLLRGREWQHPTGTPFAALATAHHVVSARPLPAELRRRLPPGALVTVCGPQLARRDARPTAPPRFRLGFANMNDRHPFCLEVRHGLERAAAEAGNVELILADNRESGGAAVANAEALLAAGVDLVIEYQLEEAAGNWIMDRFRAAGVPVIAVDVPMPGAVFFGVDNYRAGILAGEALGRAIRQRWRSQLDAVLALELPLAGPLPRARLQGQLDGLRANLPLPPDARSALVGMNDETVLGAIAALRAAGRAGQALAVTQGLDRRARQELAHPDTPLIGGVTFHPERYGERLIPLALDILQGRPVPPAVYLEHEFVERQALLEAGATAAPSSG